MLCSTHLANATSGRPSCCWDQLYVYSTLGASWLSRLVVIWTQILVEGWEMCHLSAETLLPRGKSGDHKDKGLRNFSNTAFQVCFYLVRIQNHGVNLCKNLQKELSIYPESKLYQQTSPSPSCISIPQGVLSENTQPLDVQVFHCGRTLKIKSRVQDMTLGNSGSVLKFEWVVYCLNPMQW